MGMPGTGSVQDDARLRGVAGILLRCSGVKEKQKLVQRDAARRRRTRRGLRASVRHGRDRIGAPSSRLPSPRSSFIFQCEWPCVFLVENLTASATFAKLVKISVFPKVAESCQLYRAGHFREEINFSSCFLDPKPSGQTISSFAVPPHPHLRGEDGPSMQ